MNYAVLLLSIFLCKFTFSAYNSYCLTFYFDNISMPSYIFVEFYKVDYDVSLLMFRVKIPKCWRFTLKVWVETYWNSVEVNAVIDILESVYARTIIDFYCYYLYFGE